MTTTAYMLIACSSRRVPCVGRFERVGEAGWELVRSSEYTAGGEFACGWCTNRGPVEGVIDSVDRID